MSRSLNKAMIIGNLGADPEIRSTGGGSRVANISVATSRSWKGRDGSDQEKTEWHRIVAWENPNAGAGDPFNVIEKFAKKGDRVYVEGEIEYRSYEDKDGVTKYSTEIVIRRGGEILLLGGSEPRSGGQPARAGAASGGSNASSGGSDYDDFEAPAFGDDEDDLPF